MIDQQFRALRQIRPATFFVNTRYNNFRLEHENFLDHIFAYMPKRPLNYQYYGFPSTVIGYPGVFQALSRHTGEAVLPFEEFRERLERGLSQEREQTRADLAIAEKFVILVSPGSSKAEAEFTFKQFRKMFGEYSKQNKLGKEAFSVLVTLPTQTDPTEAQAIRGLADQLATLVQVKCIPEEQRHAAMAAADFGLIYNGEMVAEAAACHLSTLVLENMSFGKAYFENLFNMRISTLNLATGMLGFEELKCESECAAPRLAEILDQHVSNPKLRHFYSSIYDRPLHEMRCREAGQHVEGFTFAARKISKAMQLLRNKAFEEADIDRRREMLPHLKDTRGMYAKA
jgi:hypothetical protein